MDVRIKADYIKVIFKSNSKIILNFLYLFASSGVNLLIPILLTPFLIRTVGIELFGIIGISQLVCNNFLVIADYGFNLSAVRDLSIYHSQKKTEEIEQLFNEVLNTKFLILALSFIAFYYITKLLYSDHHDLFLLSYLLVIGQSSVPSWFYQGIQEMRYVTLMNFTSKVVAVSIIFYFVNKDNYIWVNYILGFSGLIVGVLAHIHIVRKFKFKIKILPFNVIQKVIKSNFKIFLANLSISSYLNLNGIILSFYANGLTIGYYAAAEKIMFVVRSLLTIFSNATYPHVCSIVDDKKKFRYFIKSLYVPFAIFFSLLCLIVFLLSKEISSFLGLLNSETHILIKMFSITPLIVLLNIPFNQFILASNKQSVYIKILVAASLLSITSNFLLAYFFKSYGTICSIAITELFITISFYLYFRRSQKQ